jgi:hypothetical protein
LTNSKFVLQIRTNRTDTIELKILIRSSRACWVIISLYT